MQSQQKNSLIEASGVWMRYDSKVILKDVTLSINKGDFIAITGPNGGGKTTLLRLLLKLISPSKGTINYFDSNHRQVARLPIGYLPQKSSIDSSFPVSVRDVIGSGLLGTPGIDKTTFEEKIQDTIKLVGLESHQSSAIGNLSGGQLQRTLLGRALISSPEILVLDEPLSYIDKRFEHHLYDIIESVAANTTILLVSHEMTTIAGMASRHLIIDHELYECPSSHHHVYFECDENNQTC